MFRLTTRHKLRNGVMLLRTHYEGLRVGEVAALTYENILQADSRMAVGIRLAPKQTKGKHTRTTDRHGLGRDRGSDPCIMPAVTTVTLRWTRVSVYSGAVRAKAQSSGASSSLRSGKARAAASDRIEHPASARMTAARSPK